MCKDEIVIAIDGGSLEFVVNKALAELQGHGITTTRRASLVVPLNPILHRLFTWLRSQFGEEGRVAAWTRGWQCQWLADLAPSEGPVLGPFQTRQEAIKAEVDWLQNRMLQQC